MKKFGFFAVALAAAAISFTSCKDNGQNNGGGVDLNALPNGFYVSEQGADLVAANAMDQGINEVDQKPRTGMYEKYIVLEAGKKYEFVNKKGENADRYGATLEYGDSLIVTDKQNIAGYKGSLAANTSIEVTTTSLYHIVLDFNEDGNLTDVGGAQCIIVPVEWGIRGGIADWNNTILFPTKSENNIFIFETVTVEQSDKFKFAHNDAWKIELDIAKLVKANTNLGVDCVPGGGDIEIGRGVYTITLEFVGPAATTQESFKYTIEKTADLEVADPKTFVVGLSGDGVACGWNDPSGDALAVVNAAECKITDEATLAGTYVYDIADVAMIGGKEFKVRYNGGWFGGKNTELSLEGATFEGDDNFKIPADAHYSVKFTVEWNGEKATAIKAAFTAL